MPNRLLILLAGAALIDGASAQAQADVTYNGKWRATIVADDGARRAARLVVSEFSGTWYGAVGTRPDGKKPCQGTKFPVTVQTSNEKVLEFTVWGSSVGPACNDLTVSLTLTGDDVFEGSVVPAGRIKLTRR